MRSLRPVEAQAEAVRATRRRCGLPCVAVRQRSTHRLQIAAALGCAIGGLLLPACGPGPASEDTPEYARAANRGKAYLENRDPALAAEAFKQALAMAPDSPAALRNLARAYLAARETEPLPALLERARALEPDSVATHYLSGLMELRRARIQQAAAYFEEAVRLDPYTATLRFQLASAYQSTGQEEKAVEQLHETLRLDPFHAAAHYRLGGVARRAGDREELERRLRELERLRSLFGDQSYSAEALEACQYTQAEPATARAQPRAEPWDAGVRFQDATAELLVGEAGAPAVAAAVLDVSERGRYTLFVLEADGRASLLEPEANGALRRSPLELQLPTALAASQRLVGLAGQFRPGDARSSELQLHSDLLLLGDGGARLLERTGLRAFADVTASAGLSEARGFAARWVDYEHDGDVDLLVGGETGLALWQNGGDGHFEEVARSAGLDETQPVQDVAVGDFENNVAVDVVAARGARPTRVFENQRAGQFAPQPEPPGPWPAARFVLIDDLDNDGLLDAALVGNGRALIQPGRGGATQRIDLGGLEPRAATLIDLDNDGWLDLLVGGAQSGADSGPRLALWRNGAEAGWSDVSASTGIGSLARQTPNSVTVADLDGDGDSDVLLLTAGGLRLLRNDGGNAGGQIKLRLVGTKTNPSGIGTRVEVRAGNFLASRAISSLPVEIGLGDRTQLDSVQTVWTNGVVDNQVQLTAPAQPLTVVETVVATGSCPFLYAWDGGRFRFVTDLLGNSPLGLSIRRGEVLPADPDEFVRVGDARSLVARDGHYVLQVTEETREVLYLDEARLVAADHAPDVEVHPTDRLMPEPFPPSELWALRAPRAPRSAIGDDGVDRTGALRAIDGRFAPPGPPMPPPLRGVTYPLAITLDFGPLDDVRAPVLALTGWLQYGDASTNIALSQNASAAFGPTRLELEAADGTWQPLDVAVGVPAGKTKTILVDLADVLTPGARRLRLHSSVELHWDRVALLERLPDHALELHEAGPASASLRWRGYSDIRARAPHHPTTPDWDRVFERPPWRTTPEGWVTRYGDVRELVVARDARLALLNGGDALELQFAASDFPLPAEGRARTFFFYSVGWDKDGDHNVVDGDRVEPLPVLAEAGDDWRIRFNTRWVPRDAPVRGP
jgi:tetratricopeptide (TPR) repeat protein